MQPFLVWNSRMNAGYPKTLSVLYNIGTFVSGERVHSFHLIDIFTKRHKGKEGEKRERERERGGDKNF